LLEKAAEMAFSASLAAGSPTLLMIGPPGPGNSMIAQGLLTIMLRRSLAIPRRDRHSRQRRLFSSIWQASRR
jgi:hypothetical protein